MCGEKAARLPVPEVDKYYGGDKQISLSKLIECTLCWEHFVMQMICQQQQQFSHTFIHIIRKKYEGSAELLWKIQCVTRVRLFARLSMFGWRDKKMCMTCVQWSVDEIKLLFCVHNGKHKCIVTPDDVAWSVTA